MHSFSNIFGVTKGDRYLIIQVIIIIIISFSPSIIMGWGGKSLFMRPPLRPLNEFKWSNLTRKEQTEKTAWVLSNYYLILSRK